MPSPEGPSDATRASGIPTPVGTSSAKEIKPTAVARSASGATPVSGRGSSVSRRGRKTPRTRRWWLIGAAVTALALAWFVGRPYLLGPVVFATPVLRADLVQTLVASGHVETPFRVSVSSQITGVVTRVPVNEGATVRAGDTLLTLDAREARALLIQSEGQLAQASARLRQLRETTLPSARQTLAEASAILLNEQQNFDRNLAALGFDTPASLDAAKASLEVARARVKAAELQVAASSIGGTEYVVAESQVAQARANLEAVRVRMSYHVVTAPRAGVLIARSVAAGDVVQPGEELMVLSPIGDVDIVVRIDERNLGLITVGQSAIASADAYPAESFPARVTFINPSVDRLRASVEVKLRVPEPPATLRQDMTVTVDIEVARRPGTLIVPAADIYQLGASDAWVFTVSEGRVHRRAVRVGLVSAGRAEIVSGLAEGERVVSRSATALNDGQRVRVELLQTPDERPDIAG